MTSGVGMLSPFLQGCQTHQATCLGLIGKPAQLEKIALEKTELEKVALEKTELEKIALEKTDPASNSDTEDPPAIYSCEPLYNHGCTYCELGLCLLWNDAGESCLSQFVNYHLPVHVCLQGLIMMQVRTHVMRPPPLQ